MSYDASIRSILVLRKIPIEAASDETKKFVQGYCKSVSPQQDALEFLDAAIHDKARDPGHVELLSCDAFVSENAESLPGLITSSAGFFVFGKAGDGSSYLIDVRSSEIFLLSIGCVQEDGIHTYDKPPRRLPINLDAMRGYCETSWRSPSDFLADWKAAIAGEKEWKW